MTIFELIESYAWMVLGISISGCSFYYVIGKYSNACIQIKSFFNANESKYQRKVTPYSNYSPKLHLFTPTHQLMLSEN